LKVLAFVELLYTCGKMLFLNLMFFHCPLGRTPSRESAPFGLHARRHAVSAQVDQDFAHASSRACLTVPLLHAPATSCSKAGLQGNAWSCGLGGLCPLLHDDAERVPKLSMLVGACRSISACCIVVFSTRLRRF
jgi:hypothetical protein